jgi:hypothetical protein
LEKEECFNIPELTSENIMKTRSNYNSNKIRELIRGWILMSRDTNKGKDNCVKMQTKFPVSGDQQT